ncbi:hypothetical protein ALC62_12012, partial [Cyphomyrmex costatus]
CRGYCMALQFASFLASWSAIEPLDWPTFIPTPVYGYVRTQAAPYPENMSAEIQKAGPIGTFTRYSTTLVLRRFSWARQGNDLLPGDRLSEKARVRDGNSA